MTFRRLTFSILMIVLTASTLLADDTSTLTLDSWLLGQPIRIPQAIIDPDTSFKPVKEALKNQPVNPFEFWPAAGEMINLTPGQSFSFVEGAGLSYVLPTSDGVSLAYAATYIKADRWAEAKVAVSAQAAFKLFVNGEEAVKMLAQVDSAKSESKTVILDQGLNRLLLVTAVDGGTLPANWDVAVTVTPETPKDVVYTATTSPLHGFDFQDYYRQESLQDLDMSPDGRLVAARRAFRSRKDDKTYNWLEVWDMKTKTKIWEYRHGKGLSGTEWSPDSKSMLMIVPGSKGSDLLLWDSQNFSMSELMHNLEDASAYKWSPDSKGLYYVKSYAFKKDEKIPYKVMWSLEDRWAGWRDDAEIH